MLLNIYGGHFPTTQTEITSQTAIYLVILSSKTYVAVLVSLTYYFFQCSLAMLECAKIEVNTTSVEVNTLQLLTAFFVSGLPT